MATNSQTNALLTEHFRYTPLTLLDDIINVVNELVFRAVGALEDGFAARPAQHLGFKLDKDRAAALPNDESRQDALEELKQNEADNGIVQLESLLNATVDKDFDKFEIYTLRNILAVGHREEDLANWVRLDHYKGIDAASAESAPNLEDVELQRRRLHETAKLNIMLKAEEARNAAVLDQLNALVNSDEVHNGPFAFLNDAAKAQATAMTQDTQYALDQLPELQKLLVKLKETVQNAPKPRPDDEDSADARRRKYLNTQSLRALERRGIDPDTAAGASLAGRRLGRDEIEGIEKVAESLGVGKNEEQDVDVEMESS